MNKFRALLFAAILFLSSCSQNAEIPEIDYVLISENLGVYV